MRCCDDRLNPPVRRRSTLGYVSPVAFEQRAARAVASFTVYRTWSGSAPLDKPGTALRLSRHASEGDADRSEKHRGRGIGH